MTGRRIQVDAILSALRELRRLDRLRHASPPDSAERGETDARIERVRREIGRLSEGDDDGRP